MKKQTEENECPFCGKNTTHRILKGSLRECIECNPPNRKNPVRCNCHDKAFYSLQDFDMHISRVNIHGKDLA